MDILEYLREVAKLRLSIAESIPRDSLGPEAFVLKYGRSWRAAKRPDRFAQLEPNLCFMNALHLTIEHPELSYVEGYAHGDVIPFEHAWCAAPDGSVIDATLDHPEDYSFFGIAFDTAWALRQVRSRGFYGVIEDIQNNYPLLRGMINQETFMDKRWIEHGDDRV